MVWLWCDASYKLKLAFFQCNCFHYNLVYIHIQVSVWVCDQNANSFLVQSRQKPSCQMCTTRSISKCSVALWSWIADFWANFVNSVCETLIRISEQFFLNCKNKKKIKTQRTHCIRLLGFKFPPQCVYRERYSIAFNPCESHPSWFKVLLNKCDCLWKFQGKLL